MSPPPPFAPLDDDAFVAGLAAALVRDRATDEDARQEAWMAALRRRENPLRFGAWLRGAARLLTLRGRRGEERRRRHENIAAAGAGAPSPADVLAREAVRRRVIDAVLALAPAYRDVVLLRFWERLPPREVARRLDLPVETVRTRLKRAAAALRARLDDERDATDWRLALLPLAPATLKDLALAAASGVAATGAATKTALGNFAIGAAAMTAKQTSFAALVVLLLAGAAYLLRPKDDAPPPDLGSRIAPTPATRAETPRGPDGAAPVAAAPFQDAPEDDPASRAAASKPATTAVVVRATFERGGAPAVGAWIRLEESGRHGVPRRARADASGTARFDNVVPKQFSAGANLGGNAWGKAVEGETTVVELKIPPGPRLVGRVVDEFDRPVADAAVMVGDLGPTDFGETAAQTDADGRFAVPVVVADMWVVVWARKDGYVPSERPVLTGKVDAELNVVLRLQSGGAALRGRVVDADGAPVAWADVRIGVGRGSAQMQLPGGGSACARAEVATTADGDGRFAAAGLEPGETTLVVGARNRSPWRGAISLVGGETRDVEVALGPAAELRGVVTDAAKKPVHGVSVSIGDWNDPARRATGTSADGAYVLRDLAAGDAEVVFELDGARRRETVKLTAGEATTLDVRLDEGGTIRIRVVDERGNPLARVRAEAQFHSFATNDFHFANETSDAAGRIALKNCRPEKYAVRLEHPDGGGSLAVLADVRPDEPERTVVVDAERMKVGEVRGAVVGEDGRPPANVQITLVREDALENGSPVSAPDAGTGAFRFRAVAGEYLVQASAPGLGTVRATTKVAPGGTGDVGTLRFLPTGTVVVRPLPQDGATLAGASVTLLQHGVPVENLGLSGATATFEGVAPGAYEVDATSGDGSARRVGLVVASGATTTIDVALKAGRLAHLRAGAKDGPPHAPLATIFDADGATVRTLRLWRAPGGGDPQVSTTLPPGEYRIEMTEGARRGAGKLVVSTDDGAPNTAVVVLE